MAGKASFRAQQSRWLYQHGLGEMTYNGTRHGAASQRAPLIIRRGGRAPFGRCYDDVGVQGRSKCQRELLDA